MTKKNYKKPRLKSRHMQLGVFGDYGDNGGHRTGTVTPAPVILVGDLDLRME